MQKKSMKLSKIISRCTVCMIAGILTAPFCAIASVKASAGESAVYEKVDFAMDTVVSEKLYTTGEDKTGEILQILKDVEENWISWTNENSEIYQLNTNSGQTVTVSEETAEYLKQVLQLSEDSDGAMDPTLGRVIRLWNISGENPQVPEDAELKKLMKDTGYQKVSLTDDEVTLDQGCTLDLGAVGKGIGCDAVLNKVKNASEITGFILNLGGSSVLVYGEKPDQSPWKVAVTDPRDEEGEYLGVVSLRGNEFLATSGDYEKYFMQEGVRYHHILDPSTGYPARTGLTSVTVVCDTGVYADGLSTACLVLGMEKSVSLLEKYDADALFVDEDHHIYMTGGMQERFELLKDSYTAADIGK